MSTEDTVTIKMLLSVDTIALYVWVFGVAIVGNWKKADTHDWFKLSLVMLGVDEELKWKMTEDGLKICRPDKKPCEHAYVFKIVRR